MAEADPAIVRDTATPAPASPARKPWGRWALMLAVPLALAGGAFLYWESLAGKASTDNAYIKQDMVSVSAEVGGRIVEGVLREDRVHGVLFNRLPRPRAGAE